MCEADDSLIFLRIFQKPIECTAESIYRAMPVYEKECKSMAKVTRKDFRELTVSEATNYGRRTAPMLRIVFCKHFLDKVAKHFWTLLQVQIGQSCKASTGSYPASRIAIADHI